MSSRSRDRRLTRHGRYILTDDQLDQLTETSGQKVLFDTVIVTEFVSNPVSYLSQIVDAIKITKPSPELHKPDRKGKKLKDRLKKDRIKQNKISKFLNNLRESLSPRSAEDLAKAAAIVAEAQAIAVKLEALNKIQDALQDGNEELALVLISQYDSIYNQIDELEAKKALMAGDTGISTTMVSRLNSLTDPNSTSKVKNPELVGVMPPNSIIGIKISDINKLDRMEKEVFFPFFPTSFSLPVKPGEQVWTFYDNIKGKKVGYWMFRKVGTLPVEDLNYTHLDRNSTLQTLRNVLKSSAPQPTKQSIIETTLSGFVNPASSGVPDSTTIQEDDGYEQIIEESTSYNREYAGEAVPRYYKKCGDLTLQGSNNTLITLTSIDNRIYSSQDNSGLGSSGEIRIQCGRGRNGTDYNFDFLENERGIYQRDSSLEVLTDQTVRSPPSGNALKEAGNARMTPEANIFLNCFNGGTIGIESKGNVRIETGGLTMNSSSHSIFSSNTSIDASQDITLAAASIEAFARDEFVLTSQEIKLDGSKVNINQANEPYVIHSALESVLDKLIADVATLNQTMTAIAASAAAATALPATPGAVVGISTAILSSPPPLIISNADVASEMQKLKSKTIFGSK